MFKPLAALLGAVWISARVASAEVLIVADEFPAMEVLARKLQAEAGISSRLVAQTNLPPRLAPFEAVVVYIHGNLNEAAEQQFVSYTEAGGKLIPLHHAISSGKRKNKQWFNFLGIDLPAGELAQGGYKWIEPVTLDYFSLAPDHFIMTNRVSYPRTIRCRLSDPASSERTYPGYTLENSEVYLNHQFTSPRTVLMGFRYVDPASQTVYAQDRGGWLRPYGKGWIIYFQPGHSASDFEDPTYGQILLNAVLFKK